MAIEKPSQNSYEEKRIRSRDNYLKAIYILRLNKGRVISKDICQHMGYSRASVSAALSKLIDEGHIIKEDILNGNIRFTPKGEQLAETIYYRNQLIQSWLIKLGLSPETAYDEASAMEHALGSESIKAITEHVTMAQRVLGDKGLARDKISQIESNITNSSKRLSEINIQGEVLKEVEEYGDISSVKRAFVFLDDYGGIDEVEKGINAIEKLGGIDELRKLSCVIEQAGGVDKLIDNYHLAQKVSQLCCEHNSKGE